MVKSNNTQVTISAAMLNCLKQVLFSQTDGVDLSPIVEDLGGEDSMAIAVALAYKGIKPEIDTTTRFELGYSSYAKCEFKSYSIIKDAVRVKKTYLSWNKETHCWDICDQPREIEISLNKWLSLSTSPDKCMAEVLSNLGIKPEEESKTVLRVSPKD